MSPNKELEQGTPGWFIDTVLLGEMRRMIIGCELHYLGFGVVASGVEFLGACMDDHPMNEGGHSKTRFNEAIRGLFDTRYREFVEPRDPEYDLNVNLRCGMAHVVRPQGKIGFTHRAESRRLGTLHLQLSGSVLALVSEDFHEDFAKAASQLRDRMSKGEFKKGLTDGYLAVPHTPSRLCRRLCLAPDQPQLPADLAEGLQAAVELGGRVCSAVTIVRIRALSSATVG